MSRRSILKALAALLSAFWTVIIVFPIFRYLQRPKDDAPQISEVEVGPESDILPGSSKTFKYGKKPGLLIRDDKGELHAFEAVCSHLACTVQHRPKKGDIYCACHSGVYDLAGGNVSGPPPKPLTPLKVAVNENGLVVVSKA